MYKYKNIPLSRPRSTVGVQKYLDPPFAAKITAFHFNLFCPYRN